MPCLLAEQLSRSVCCEIQRYRSTLRSTGRLLEVACESCCKDNMVMVFGEITTKAPLDYDKIVRETCQGIGYDVFEEDLASACIFAVSVFSCMWWTSVVRSKAPVRWMEA